MSLVILWKSVPLKGADDVFGAVCAISETYRCRCPENIENYEHDCPRAEAFFDLTCVLEEHVGRERAALLLGEALGRLMSERRTKRSIFRNW